MPWPPVKSTVAWNEENLNTYDAGSNTLTASGTFNLSSTGSLAYLTLEGFDGNSSWLSINVLTKGSGNTDTYQLTGGYTANGPWFDVDNALSVTQAEVGTPSSGKAWNKGQLAGFPYYQLAYTLDPGTTSTIVGWAYTLVPGGF
jgi:hypothetical protein